MIIFALYCCLINLCSHVLSNAIETRDLPLPRQFKIAIWYQTVCKPSRTSAPFTFGKSSASPFEIQLIMKKQRDSATGQLVWEPESTGAGIAFDFAGAVLPGKPGPKGTSIDVTITLRDFAGLDAELQKCPLAKSDERCQPDLIGQPKELTLCSPGIEFDATVTDLAADQAKLWAYSLYVHAICDKTSTNPNAHALILNRPALSESPIILTFAAIAPKEPGKDWDIFLDDGIVGRGFTLHRYNWDQTTASFVIPSLNLDAMPDNLEWMAWRDCCDAYAKLRFKITGNTGRISILSSDVVIFCVPRGDPDHHQDCPAAQWDLITPQARSVCEAQAMFTPIHVEE
ncbi:hypothetical protein E5Q_03232 [Mixia osmundae IAM 14324]|uniref:Ubiquitin 3 binding protein But2 C-terminal domain-containing protein n=1 Tax=Mixia osmundae (strain CBS 9802 / IAM 14324 / JCM 22182 / KY 12970) TaxID=764103 RepID=G7E153_MIXOS|nr:hypothetical protein E5Q_03232 [Mixia osmundae IAM 14324]